MQLRAWAFGLAILAGITLLAAPSSLAQSSTSPAEQMSPARQALQWSQKRLAEYDAAIASLEQDVAKRQADVRTKAEAALKELKDQREAYRLKAEDTAAKATAMTEAQVADARKSLDEASDAFHAKLNAYLDVVNADVATRKAVLEAELEARQKALQASIDELRIEASKLAAQQKADVEARIETLKAQMDDAKARAARLQEASKQAWDTVRQTYTESEKRLIDMYESIRKSVKDATK